MSERWMIVTCPFGFTSAPNLGIAAVGCFALCVVAVLQPTEHRHEGP